MPWVSGVSGKILDAADLVQAETDQRLALVVMAALRAADLLKLDGLVGLLPAIDFYSADATSPRRLRGGETAAWRP